MALHTQLPIYKVAYGLFDVIMDLAKNMPRDFKASIGGKLRDECIKSLPPYQPKPMTERNEEAPITTAKVQP